MSIRENYPTHICHVEKDLLDSILIFSQFVEVDKKEVLCFFPITIYVSA